MDLVVERILKSAKYKGYTQKQLAEKIGVHPQVVTAWKNGSTSYTDYMVKISSVLGVTIDYLYTGTETEEAPPTAEQQLDSALAAELAPLTPDEVALVRVFVQGLKAGRKAPTSPDK